MLHHILICICISSSAAFAQPPIEAYGQLPNYRSVSISPSGNRIAFLARQSDQDYASVYDRVAGEMLVGVNINDVKTHDVFFINDRYAILRASETKRFTGFRNEIEYSAAFSWNLEKNKIEQLIRRGVELFPAQTGLGRIVGKLHQEDFVFMPAYVGPRHSDPTFDLLKVNLKNGAARTHKRGTHHTIDWIVGADGEVIAREDFNDDRNIYQIWSYKNGGKKKIFEVKTNIPTMEIVGVAPNEDALILSVRFDDSDHNAIVSMSFDGDISAPLLARNDADIERILMNANRVVFGVEYSGLVPAYEFLSRQYPDPTLVMTPHFPAAAISIADWAEDFEHLVIYVSGGDTSPGYYLYDQTAKSISRLAQAYADIPDNALGDVHTMEFKARDGASISSILTLPPSAEVKGAHATIIMPHGGPEEYDNIGFNWMAQYFSNRGYAVLQPNFRGSAGFGHAFEKAGHGQWGRGVMQHDITDAVEALIRENIADPERICIVGSSYGGYAALAGGAFTPDLFKCVAAIAPVTDLPRMLIDERMQYGGGSWVVDYWEKRVGDLSKERDQLKSISPAEYPHAFEAPVLLIHGNDDTIVPFRQSVIMERALRRSDKEVKLIKVQGGDHWLSTNETRVETLRALDEFINKHIGEN